MEQDEVLPTRGAAAAGSAPAERSQIQPQPEKRTYTVDEAAQALGISRGLAFDLIRQDEFPVPVIRLGTTSRAGTTRAPRRIVVPRAPLDALLAGSPQRDRSGEQPDGKSCDECIVSGWMDP
jgi:predicted DNA-binding transcriptional regulator AlpA